MAALAPRAIALAAVTSALVILAPGQTPVARAADEPTVLPGATSDALAVDVDGDGSRDVVRLIAGEEPHGVLFVDAWTATPEGWRQLSEPVGVERAMSVDEIERTPRHLLHSTFRPVAGHDRVRLVSWRHGAEERVLVVSSGYIDFLGVSCCLTIAEVRFDGGRVELARLGDDGAAGHSVTAVDLDGDGTDELLVTDITERGFDRRPDGGAEVRAFRWDGERFRQLGEIELVRGAGQLPIVLGDSDGRPGEEVGIVAVGGAGASGGALLTRVGLDASAGLVWESTQLPVGGTYASVAPIPGPTPRLAVVGSNRTLLARWPSGGRLEVLAEAASGGQVVGVLGEGASAQLLIEDRSRESVRAVGSGLDPLATFHPARHAVAADSAGLAAYIGPLPANEPGGTGDEELFIYRGTLLRRAPDGSVQASPMVSLAGFEALARVGPAGESIALLHGAGASSREDPRRRELHPANPSEITWVSIVPTALVLSPEPDQQILAAAIEGAVVADGAANGELRVTAPPDGFSVALEAPPSSRVSISFDAFRPEAGSDASRQMTIPDSGRLTLPVPASLLPDDGRAIPARLTIAAPDGRAHAVLAVISVDRGAPPLDVNVPFVPLALNVALDGATEPGGAVSVDGRPVAVATDGTFSAPIAAGVWPMDVTLEARDAVGNSSMRVVSVVAPLDYRRLPWIPIAVIATLAVGLRFFLRPMDAGTPRETAVRLDAEGELEELQG